MVEDKGSERIVLSGLSQHGKDALTDVEDLINTNSFTSDLNQYLFNAIKIVIGESGNVDVPSILAASNRLGYGNIVSKAENLSFLKSLFLYPSKIENVRVHARVVKKLEIARQLKSIHRQCAENLSEVQGTESLAEILAISEKPIYDAGIKLGNEDETRPENLAKDGGDYLEYLLNNPVDNIGIPSPFPIWNELIGGGLISGGVSLVAARLKTGKSSLAIQVGLHTAINLGIPTLYLDTELTRLTQQFIRGVSNVSGIPFQQILKGKFGNTRKSVFEAQKKIEDSPFVHKRIAGTPFPEVLSIIRRWLHQDVGIKGGKVKQCLVIYDWFKLADSSSLSSLQEYQAIGFQMAELTNLAGEYEFPVLGLAQSNKDGITKDDSSVVGMSDRLGQLCISLSLLKRKTAEEIVEDGKQNGNLKLLPIECRFGPGIDWGDYINMNLTGKISRVTEIGLKSQSTKDERDESGNIIF